jgi:hypothetical protein
MDKEVTGESIAKIWKGNSGEPSTSTSGHLASENVPATTSARSTIEESNIIVTSLLFVSCCVSLRVLTWQSTQ